MYVTQKGCLLFWPVKKYAWLVDFFIYQSPWQVSQKVYFGPSQHTQHGTAAKNTCTRAWHRGQKHAHTSMAQRPKTRAHEHGTAAKNTRTRAWHSGPTHTTQLFNKEKKTMTKPQ